LVLASALIFAGCEQSPSVLNPKGPVAATEATLFWIILGIATFIFVVVTAVLIYSIVRFRGRPNMPEPRQIDGNNRLEIAWTIAPSFVLFVVLIFTIAFMFNLTPASASTMHVTAIGHQWWWEFRYTDESPLVVTGDELHVPVGTNVDVLLQSDNVIHSLWVPQLSGKTDVIPGHNNHLIFQASVAGTFKGECAEYCGTQHAHMDFIVVADQPASFSNWLTAQQAGPVAPTTADAQAGMALFRSAGCAGCHAITGINSPAQGQGPLIGPNLTHFGSRQVIAGYVLSNTTPNLTAWLKCPQCIKPGSDMVIPVQLSDQDVANLVAYLQSLQ
jgi:cytochrome c oxidase subunit 2